MSGGDESSGIVAPFDGTVLDLSVTSRTRVAWLVFDLSLGIIGDLR